MAAVTEPLRLGLEAVDPTGTSHYEPAYCLCFPARSFLWSFCSYELSVVDRLDPNPNPEPSVASFIANDLCYSLFTAFKRF